MHIPHPHDKDIVKHFRLGRSINQGMLSCLKSDGREFVKESHVMATGDTVNIQSGKGICEWKEKQNSKERLGRPTGLGTASVSGGG